MDWKFEDLHLDSRTIVARCSGLVTVAEAKEIYSRFCASVDLAVDTLFIHCPSIKLRPLDAANPDAGYVSDDSPDAQEVWWLSNCVLSDSVRVAVQHFDAPKLDQCINPNFDRLEMLRFLASLPEAAALTLSFVDDGFLEFRYRTPTSSFDEKCLKRVLDYKARNFKCEFEADEEKWQWETFKEHGSFLIGAV